MPFHYTGTQTTTSNCWLTLTTNSTATATTTTFDSQQYWNNHYNQAALYQRLFQQQEDSVLRHYASVRWHDEHVREIERQASDHKEEAKARAEKLLLSNLTPNQQETYKKNKWFVVHGSKSGKTYRIRSNTSIIANIDVLEGSRVTHRLCGHCDPKAVPMGDQLLAQKLMLETDEEGFLQIANRHAA